jgi:hypothetical protein
MHRARILLWLGWGLAVVFLGTTVLVVWQQSRPVAGVTSDSLQKIKEGMSLHDVEQLLGAGRPGPGPLASMVVEQGPESAVWKHWSNPKPSQDGWEDVYALAFVNDRLAKTWSISRPINPGPVRFVKQIFSFPKLLQPPMSEDRLIYEYRGGYVDCWVEVVADGQKEVIGLISHEQLREKREKLTADVEDNTHGLIFWDPTGSGPKDLTLLVTATTHQAQGLVTTSELKQGLNHRIKEKWPELYGKWHGSFHGPESSLLTPGKEILLYALKSKAGEMRLMCKLIEGSK